MIQELARVGLEALPLAPPPGIGVAVALANGSLREVTPGRPRRIERAGHEVVMELERSIESLVEYPLLTGQTVRSCEWMV